jgi:hypothetical protein
MKAWGQGDRQAAHAVAVPSAVSDLFAIPRPAGGVQSRGCTDASTNPGTCTYADLNTGTLYEVEVAQVPGGWYVTSVTPET